MNFWIHLIKSNGSLQFSLFVYLHVSLYTATRPHGHSGQAGAASVSIRQKKKKSLKA